MPAGEGQTQQQPAQQSQDLKFMAIRNGSFNEVSYPIDELKILAEKTREQITVFLDKVLDLAQVEVDAGRLAESNLLLAFRYADERITALAKNVAIQRLMIEITHMDECETKEKLKKTLLYVIADRASVTFIDGQMAIQTEPINIESEE